MIAIIDYGMGNIHSVQKALEFYSAKAVVTNKPKEIQQADKAILPGVGAFDEAMLELEKQKLVGVLKDCIIKKKMPFLGICLGMQLLFEESEEAVSKKGLGLLKGKVKRFQEQKGFKVPHMGWNQLKFKNKSCLLLKDIPENSNVYFCHSYYPYAKEQRISAAITEYGIDFSSVVWQDNIYGVQFHPEKSQKVGLKIIENFVKLC